jgi:hypothetical protein
MASFLTTFASATAPSVIAGRDTAADFTITFDPPLDLAGKRGQVKGSADLVEEWVVGLVAWYGFNSVPTISAALYNNARFTYNGGTGPINVDFVPGIYSIAQLNADIQTSLLANSFLATDIAIAGNSSTGFISITLAAGFSWDLTTSDFYQLLGFELVQSPVLAGTTVGNSQGNMNNGVTAFYLHCDAVESSFVNGRPSDVIAIYQPDVAPGRSLDIIPFNPIYLRTRQTDRIQSIRLYVTDSLDRPVNFNGDTPSTNSTAWTLEFKQIPSKLY